MTNILVNAIAAVILTLVLGAAIVYIVKAKRSGKRCIGCPDGCTCGSEEKESSCKGCSANCGRH